MTGRPIARPQFDPDIDRAFNIFFGMDDIDQVRSCFDECAAEKFPQVLMGNGACNSAVDPTYAPSDGHCAFWWPFAPYAVAGDAENWDRHKADYAERVLGVWREYASNLDDGNVRAKYLFTPLDVERLNSNMVRGAVRMGAYIPSQLGINRPHPLLSGTRTPVEALYLCGSSTGNGGGINGAPGYIAANTIADDLQLERPWTRGTRPRNGGTRTTSMKLFDLNGRVALVTGGNAGIGLGIAMGLAQAGAAIVIAGRRAEKNRDACRAIEAFNVQAADIEADVCDEASCRSMIENSRGTVRPYRYPRQQCRHRYPQAARKLHACRME